MVPRPDKALSSSFIDNSHTGFQTEGVAGPQQQVPLQNAALNADQLDLIVPPEPEIFLIASVPEVEDTNETTSKSTSNAKNTLFGVEMPFDLISAVYAAIVASGGIIGYAKAGSIPSLAAGLAFGGVLGFGAYQTSVNPDNYYLTYGTSTALAGMMGWRFYNSGKFMPAGLVAALSLLMVGRFTARAIGAFGQNSPHDKQ